MAVGQDSGMTSGRHEARPRPGGGEGAGGARGPGGNGWPDGSPGSGGSGAPSAAASGHGAGAGASAAGAGWARGAAAAEAAGREERRRQRADYAARIVQGHVWRLLAKGVETFLPGRRLTTDAIRLVDDPATVGAPAFVARDSGFGLQLRDRFSDEEPRREIFIRGKKNARSIGVVIAGPAAALGTRVVDAGTLARYARRLTFDTLYDESDGATVVPAVRAARAVEYVVFLDPDAGVGLCVEIDPATRRTACPLFVRFGGGSWMIVYAYRVGQHAAGADRFPRSARLGGVHELATGARSTRPRGVPPSR